MTKILGVAVAAVLAGAAATPTLAQAQEFGVDMELGYQKPSGGDGYFVVGSPIDIRVRFLSRSSVSFEPRVSLTFVTGSGSTNYNFNPGLNVQYRLGQYEGHFGPFLFAGGEVSIIGDDGGIVPSLEGGLGMRTAWGQDAMRVDGFLRYRFETDLDCCFYPRLITVGARVGFSFFH